MNIFQPADNGPSLIGAHRGYRSIRPENSLSAFEASLGHCHFIELDIQMSRDGVAVVTHDDNLGRTCNAKELATLLGKQSFQVDDWDLKELQQLDCGSWFIEADPFDTIGAGRVQPETIRNLSPQRIMTLDELLAWRARMDMPLNIEIKDQAGRPHDSRIVETVLNAVRNTGCIDKIIVSSFRHDYLRQARNMMPELLLGALQEGEHPAELLTYLADLGVDAYHPDAEITPLELIHTLRSHGFGVNIFTVNDQLILRTFLDNGATAVITDFPRLQGDDEVMGVD